MKTDLDLQLALAKMLPEKIRVVDATGDTPWFYLLQPDKTINKQIDEFSWLHICWLIEQGLDEEEWRAYHSALDKETSATTQYSTGIRSISTKATESASWQQRAAALIVKKRQHEPVYGPIPETYAELKERYDKAAAELEALQKGFPDIGKDPLKADGEERDRLREQTRERLKKACCLQQSGVPDQTALVWRIDLSRASDALILAEARLKHCTEELDQLRTQNRELRECLFSVLKETPHRSLCESFRAAPCDCIRSVITKALAQTEVKP